jgi:capsular polysaccharide biosynthesis protein
VTDTRLDEPPPQDIARRIPPEIEGDLTFLDFVIFAVQRKRLVALVTAAGTLIALLIAILLPNEYRATVTLLPPQGTTWLDTARTDKEADRKADDDRSKAAPLRRDLNELYVSLLKSRTVEDAVIQRFGLKGQYRKSSPAETRSALEKHTKIDGSMRDGLIRLTVSDRDPNRASELANGYIEQFRNLSQHLVIPEASRDGFFIQIVDPAISPERKSFPNRVRIVLAGAVAGLALGIMVAFLCGGLVRMLRDPATGAKVEILKRSVSIRGPIRPVDGTDGSGIRARHGATG